MQYKLFSFFLLWMSSFAFASTNVTISGTIKNSENKFLSIQGDFYTMDIPIEANGKFSKTITIDFVGKYILVADMEFTEIYLGENASLTIDADIKEFKNSITFGGSLGPQNNYIQKREKTANAILGELRELYRLPKDAFMAKIGNAQKEIDKLFAATSLRDAYYVEMEKQSIPYFTKALELQYDQLFQSTVSNKESKENVIAQIQNGPLYQFSMHYEAFVVFSIQGIVLSEAKNASTEKKLELLPLIQNTFLRDCIAKGTYDYMPLDHPKRNELIAKIAEQITNVKFKKQILREIQPVTYGIGEATPSFTYVNYNGGYSSSYDLKGKYTYIDVWATWCGPCRYEIPFLQKIEEEYRNKNIQFVSISVDKLENEDKWRAMIQEKKLGGIQLLAGDDKTSDFIVGYKITTIPRFILLDPNGIIISSNAPRPSDPKLIEKFKEIGIQ